MLLVLLSHAFEFLQNWSGCSSASLKLHVLPFYLSHSSHPAWIDCVGHARVQPRGHDLGSLLALLLWEG